MADEKRADESLPEGELLPDREVMSIIPPTPDLGGFGPLPVGSPDSGTTTPSPTELPGTDAAASGGGAESVTSEDRDEQFNQSDTATAES